MKNLPSNKSGGDSIHGEEGTAYTEVKEEDNVCIQIDSLSSRGLEWRGKRDRCAADHRESRGQSKRDWDSILGSVKVRSVLARSVL